MAKISYVYAGDTGYLVANINLNIGFLDQQIADPSQMIYLDGVSYAFRDVCTAGLVAKQDHVDLLLRDEVSERALWQQQFSNTAA